MTLTLDLPQELESRLLSEAKRVGLSIDHYVTRLLETEFAKPKETPLASEGNGGAPPSGARVLPKAPTARELLALPPEEIDRVLAAQAADAELLYNADLGRPVAERELTAFTAL